MSPEQQQWLVYATARVAMLLYAAALGVRIARGRSGPWRLPRGLWTLAFAVYVLHLGAAFEFVHHWDHSAAIRETARRTAEVVGVAFGGGIYVNYLFTLVWGADVIWWWRDPRSYAARSAGLELLIQSFLFFIAFNAVVVFVPPGVRWWGLAGCGVLCLLLGRRWARSA